MKSEHSNNSGLVRDAALPGVYPREAIKPYLPFWGAVVVWCVAYWPTLETLLAEWINIGVGAYGHGLLVLGICIYMLWERRRALVWTGRPLNPLGVTVVVAMGFCWLIGFAANILVVQQLSAVLLFHALILALLGFGVYRSLLFPLLLFFFAIPIWSELRDPLRDVSTLISVNALEALGVPVLNQEYRINVPGGTFVVERECSGLNFLLVSLMLSWIFSYLHNMSKLSSVVLIVLAAVIALLANWIRIILIILVGNASNMDHFLVRDHLYAGWLVFAVMLVPLFWLGGKLAPAMPAGNDRAEAPGDEPQTRQPFTASPAEAAGRPLLKLALVAGMASLFPLYASIAGYWYSKPGAAGEYALPQVEGGVLADNDFDTYVWNPQYIGADSVFRGVYEFQGQRLYVYVASYRQQAQEKELIHVANTLYDSDRWWQRQPAPADLNEAQPIRLLSLERNGRKRILGYWYKVSNRVALSAVEAKLWEVWGVLSGQRGAAVFAIALDYDNESEAQAMETVALFSSRFKAALK